MPQVDANASVAEVRLAPGEVLKATYPINRIRRPLGWLESYVIVTDARVIYRAQARNQFNRSVHLAEARIADITGVSIRAGRGLTPLGAASMITLGVLGLAIAITTRGFGLLFVVPGLALALWLACRSNLVLSINAREYSRVIAVGSGLKVGALGAFEAMWAAVLSPLVAVLRLLGLQFAEDVSLAGLDVTGENSRALDQAMRMYEELGALILEIQNGSAGSSND